MARDGDRPGFLGGGWAFPIRPGPDGRLAVTADDEAVRTCLLLVLSTAPGERVLRPDFGCGVHDLVFEANTPSLRGAVRSKVQDALVRWEPRADITDVRVETDPANPTRLLIRVDYRVRSNNAFYNLVYPFFLREGADDAG